MADITWSDVTAIAGELSTYSAAGQTIILAWANNAISVDTLDGEDGPSTKLARIYLAAHAATLSGQGGSGASGAITSESVGEISRSYGDSGSGGSSGGGTGEYNSTAYGRAYLMLIRRFGACRVPLVI